MFLSVPILLDFSLVFTTMLYSTVMSKTVPLSFEAVYLAIRLSLPWSHWALLLEQENTQLLPSFAHSFLCSSSPPSFLSFKLAIHRVRRTKLAARNSICFPSRVTEIQIVKNDIAASLGHRYQEASLQMQLGNDPGTQKRDCLNCQAKCPTPLL